MVDLSFVDRSLFAHVVRRSSSKLVAEPVTDNEGVDGGERELVRHGENRKRTRTDDPSNGRRATSSREDDEIRGPLDRLRCTVAENVRNRPATIIH